MALRVAPTASFLQSFLPIAQATLRPAARQPFLARWSVSAMPAIVIPIPSLVSDIWESILRAVPKKKTSHMKKRHRQMAGKALKDVTALNTCSSCGRTKRAHTLCPHCVASIKRWFGTDFKPREMESKAAQTDGTPKALESGELQTEENKTDLVESQTEDKILDSGEPQIAEKKPAQT